MFVRDAYLQRRLYLVFDGNPPQSAQSGDDANWAEEALRESEEPAANDDDATTPPTDESDPTQKQ